MGQSDSRNFSGKVVCNLPGHTKAVTYCDFSPDGEILATCSSDKSVILWQASNGQLLRTLLGHTAEVTSCCFYDNILATASKDTTVFLWLYQNGKRASKLTSHSAAVLSCALSSNGRYLATGSHDKTAHLVPFCPGPGACLQGGKLRKLKHHGAVNHVLFLPNADLLATASDDKTIRLWDTDTGACVVCLEDHFGPVKKLCFTPTNNDITGHMISLSEPGNFLSVWNMETHVVENVLETSNAREIQNVAISPDGQLTIGLSKDNKITVWEKTMVKSVPSLRTTDHKKGITSIAINGEKCLIATGDGEGMVFLWNSS